MIDFPANPTVGDSFQNGNTIYKCVAVNPAVWSATVAAGGIPDAPADGKLYGRKSAAWSEVSKTALGLGNVDNTSDANKPISTATQAALDAKEPTIAAGVAAQYWKGTKVWATLDKAAVGLGNVDNTADMSKPISTATQTALNAKENSISAPGAAYYYRGDKTWQVLNTTAVGIPAVENARQVRSFEAGVVYIGWGASGQNMMTCQIDNTYFGTTWPHHISGNCNFATSAGTTNQADRCNNWGYASGNFNNPYMRLDNSGSIRYLIFQTSNDETVRCLRQVGNPGYMEVSGSQGAFSTPLATSDERLKFNIVDSTVDASAAVKAMRMIEFDQDGNRDIVGFSGQNLKSINPRMVFEVAQPEDSPMRSLGNVLGLNTTTIIAYLAKSLQEALARIDALEARP